MSRLTQTLNRLNDDETLLVSAPANIRYLSGFTGSNGMLMVARNHNVLITDARYQIQATNEVDEFEILITTDLLTTVVAELQTRTLLIESNHLNVAQLERISELRPDIQIVKSSGLVEAQRITKDQSEIDKIREACGISTTALNTLITEKLSGLTELEIATKLERLMIDLGANARAFETIIASGPNSAIPHHQPTNRIVQPGDLLKIDFGAQFQGYLSDCTRTFVIGKPQNWQREIFEAVLAGQSLGRQIAKPNLGFNELDVRVRSVISEKGFGDFFKHGLGHGVGLIIHEDPFLSPKSDGKIAADMVFTIEPGIYLPNQGGVRIEDTGVVTEAGFDVLTEFNYELIELD